MKKKKERRRGRGISRGVAWQRDWGAGRRSWLVSGGTAGAAREREREERGRERQKERERGREKKKMKMMVMTWRWFGWCVGSCVGMCACCQGLRRWRRRVVVEGEARGYGFSVVATTTKGGAYGGTACGLSGCEWGAVEKVGGDCVLGSGRQGGGAHGGVRRRDDKGQGGRKDLNV